MIGMQVPLRRRLQLLAGQRADDRGIAIQVIEPEAVLLDVERDACHAVLALQSEWQRAGQVILGIGQLVRADRLLPDPLNLGEDAGDRALDVVRCEPGPIPPSRLLPTE